MVCNSGGYYNRIISRPVLYDMLLRQIPQHKIFLSKRVLSMTQDDEKVTIQTSDNQKHEGDILVGADGAYSGVRQNLYRQMKQDGKLPASDVGDLPYSCTCLVGQTRPLDPKEFPEILEEECSFRSLFGDARPYTVRNTHNWKGSPISLFSRRLHARCLRFLISSLQTK